MIGAFLYLCIAIHAPWIHSSSFHVQNKNETTKNKWKKKLKRPKMYCFICSKRIKFWFRSRTFLLSLFLSFFLLLLAQFNSQPWPDGGEWRRYMKINYKHSITCNWCILNRFNQKEEKKNETHTRGDRKKLFEIKTKKKKEKKYERRSDKQL